MPNDLSVADLDVCMTGLDVDAHLLGPAVHGVHERPITLGNHAAAQFAGARQHAVIGD